MLIQLFFGLIFGIIFGVFTGIVPGIHINLVAFLLVSLTSLNFFNPLGAVVFIVAMAITHTFVDFIPSIFFGAPDEDSVFSVLPGHRFLLKGNGYHAMILTLKGSLTALFIIFLISPFFIFIFPKIYIFIKNFIPFLLIFISIFLILGEKRKLNALMIFILAGFLGIAVLNLSINQPLMPLLTGLFGASNLIISIKSKTKIPKQKIVSIKSIRLSTKSLIKMSFISMVVAPFSSVLPGIGSSQAAVIGSKITRKLDTREFLFLLGTINTLVLGVSFVVLYSIQKTRTGVSVAVSKLVLLSSKTLIIILFSIFLSGLIAFILTIYLTKFISKNIHRLDYSKASVFILLFLIILTIYFSGFIGLIVFLTSTFLGMSAIFLKINRMHLMGCLLIPTILSYLF